MRKEIQATSQLRFPYSVFAHVAECEQTAKKGVKDGSARVGQTDLLRTKKVPIVMSIEMTL
jgi:hypothetical protein